MIVCPNCNHQNPDSAVQCEACYTPLPATTSCPNCGAKVQADASFCGQCGFNLKAAGAAPPMEDGAVVGAAVPPVHLVEPIEVGEPAPIPAAQSIPSLIVEPQLAESEVPSLETGNSEGLEAIAAQPPVAAAAPVAVPVVESVAAMAQRQPAEGGRTQLQQQTGRLLHTQTNTVIELPQNLTVIHLGKPNDRVPPDVDVSGFPNSEIVSRMHADIRIEGDAYYIEDVGSSNGTYINNLPLPIGNRHRLRAGDRIGLGKGDKVTFLFQLS